MKRRLTFLLVVILLLAVGGIAAAVYFRDGQVQQTYRTAPVQRTDIVRTISATGTVVPEDVVDVGSQVNGQIASFGKDKAGEPVDYGSELDEGMVLARIDDALYAADASAAEAQLAQAQSQIQTAEANRQQAQAKLQQAERDWQRAQKLGPSIALSQADYDAAQSTYEQARAAVAVAEAAIAQAHAQVSIAQASVQRARRNLAYTVITSPVSGVVIDRRVEIGQTVVSSLNAPSLFLIARDLRRMQVLVQVNEADIGSVKPGQPVTFTVDAFPGRDFRGEVRKVRLNATMTQNVVTYTVEIVTDNSDLLLLPYLTANVRFEVARRDDALAVPNAALRFTPRTLEGGAANAAAVDGQSRVWTLEDGRPVGVDVHPGLSDGAVTEVQGQGLSEGMPVIVGESSGGSGGAAAAGGSSGTTNPFAPPMRGPRRQNQQQSRPRS